MVFPTGTKTEEDAAYDREFAFSYVRPIRSAEDQFIQTENPDRSGNLLMFRDSFGNLLHPYLADAYGQAAFSRAMPYTMSLLDQTGRTRCSLRSWSATWTGGPPRPPSSRPRSGS